MIQSSHMLALIFWTLVSACRSTTLQHDQVDLRDSVIALYEEQVFDNVVRASRREPMLLITYSSLQGSVTTKVSGSGSLTKAATDNTFGAPPGVGNITDADVQTSNVTVSLSKDVLLSVKGDPVTVAESYDAFIAFAANPEYLAHSKTAPRPEDVVVFKQYGDEYYWIPESARAPFFNLYNHTVLRMNPGRVFSTLQELWDLGDSSRIQQVQ